ncbi:MAG: mechanosensitive ion channel family protein [bacterium]|nr:mechanosensitive ion channel family protein [bacterium]
MSKRQRFSLRHGMRPHLHWALMAMLAGAMALGAASAPEQAAPDIDRSSPRAAVSAFLDAMNSVQAGELSGLQAAVDCLLLTDLDEAERPVVGAERARQLFDIFEGAVVALDVLPDTSPDGQREVAFTLTPLDETGERFEVTLRKGEDEAWRVSADTVARVPEYHAAMKAAAPSEPENLAIDARLRSPRDAMRTFIEGFNRFDEGGADDALAALDLSGIEESLRAEKGAELAAYLKRVLDHHGKVIYQEIHNNPDGVPYVHIDHPAGRVVVAPVADEETGVKEWKFTAKTLETIVDVYDAVRDEEPAVVTDTAKEPRILSIAVRDWVGGHFPFLLKRSVLLENYQWCGLFLIILAGMAVSRLLAGMVVLALRRWFRHQRMSLDQKLERDFVRPIRIALMAWVWFLALKSIALPSDTYYYLRIIVATISAAGGVWAFYRMVDILGQYLAERAARTENKFDDILVPLFTRSLKVFVGAFGIVFVAEVAGFRPTSVLAGLGIGGLAFALAAKDTVANIFGSLTILLDRPFQIGDWVIVGDVEGSVESVGIRSTRIRTFYNSLISLPNSQLISATVDNMGARRYRRVSTKLGVTYDTPPEKIEAFCEGVRELIRQHPYTRKDYYHVWLNEFASDSLNILLYCFWETPEWSTELRERHRLFLDIIRLAKSLGVEFAFPTQTLHLRRDSVDEAAPSVSPEPPAAIMEGRDQATRIVDEILGGKDAPKPPPVDFTPPGD